MTLRKGDEQVLGSTDLALKVEWIVDFYSKSSELADFENTVDRGSAVIFDVDSGMCLSYARILGPKRNWDHRSFFSLGWYVNECIQIISSFERSSFKIRCKTVIVELYCVIVIKHFTFFTFGRD